MTTNVPDDGSSSASVRGRQIAIMTQLLKAVTTMYSIDELFQWLCYAIVQHFNLELVQFWTPAINETGVLSTHLRMMVTRDPSLPGQFVLNDQILGVVRRITFEQRAVIPPQQVDSLFPGHQASLLRRYNLNYCIGGFMNSNVLLPPPRSTTHTQEPAPFALTHLLFLPQIPHRDLVPTINVILRQTVELAINRKLLLPVPSYNPFVQNPNFAPSFSQPMAPETPLPMTREFVPSLDKLVPKRKESADLMVSSNPFARSAEIGDKQARRLHSAIDGHLTVAELSQSTGMDMRTISLALQTLLRLNRVELHDAQGKPVNPDLIFGKD